jgi:hypothetical protein
MDQGAVLVEKAKRGEIVERRRAGLSGGRVVVGMGVALLLVAGSAGAAAPGSSLDLTRFWVTGGAAIGVADSAQTHFALSLGAVRYLYPRFGVGAGALLAGMYSGSSFGATHSRSVYTVHGCSEYAVWRGHSASVVATGELGVAWWLETTSFASEFGWEWDGERGIHSAVGVAVIHREPEQRWGLLLHVAYHPDMGQNFGTSYVTIALGMNRQRW